jgi:D-tagatose-1,6-bisphosphate aldolase subunit GatZ/KbaZ
VIGSEVPTPGGPQEATDTVVPTAPERFLDSYHAFEDSFRATGLEEIFARVVAFVVQPGVEFTGDQIFGYDRKAAAGLCASLGELPGALIFEGHSTDYQTPDALKKLVEDGVAVLKVGPALTFALRQGLMALESIEQEVAHRGGPAPSGFGQRLESAMRQNDSSWKNHYAGTEQSLRLQRRYSFFDRARYYLPDPEVGSAIERLIGNLEKIKLPLGILSQYMPQSYERVRAGLLSAAPRELLKDCIKHYLRGYAAAVKEF